MDLFFFDESQIAITYLIYFIFSIVFYSTLTLFICIKNTLNYCWFCFFGFLYVVIATIVFYFIIDKDLTTYGFDLFLCISEILFFNSGLTLSFCRGVLSHSEIAWNVLNIEIYKLYPLLVIFAIPALLFIALILCLFGGCCFCQKNFRYN